MKSLIWLCFLLTNLSFGQAHNAVDGIKIATSIQVYVQNNGEENYTKLSTDKELVDYFQKSTLKVYEYQDFYLDFIKQHKTLKKVENQIATGNFSYINKHLKELKNKGVTDFAVVFSIIDADVEKKTITLYDIGGYNDQDYRQLSRIILDKGESLKPEDISKLFYLGMVVVNQENAEKPSKKEINIALESIRETLELNEIAMGHLERKARQIDDHYRADIKMDKQVLKNESKPTINRQ